MLRSSPMLFLNAARPSASRATGADGAAAIGEAVALHHRAPPTLKAISATVAAIALVSR
jgi:hypothetical protein